ncbi:MAG: hypothetical protein M1831_004996 [Alyxoria varia]|nr:MAG: hypothetical protein M1831_004996 [Alyxoria varia]
MKFLALLKSTSCALVVSGVAYVIFLALLAIPFFQNQVIYLHRVTLTGSLNLNLPEQWGFLHNQVTPFYLQTPDGERLHAWHILPLELYRRNERALQAEPEGPAADIASRLSFKLLCDDPHALLILYFHGAGGTLGSGYRPPSYRALYSGAPDKIHTIAIDYRGYGQSSGSPSENGLSTDALTLAYWAADVAKIPPSRIVLFGQSLGTAVAISLAHRMATASEAGREPTSFRGMVLVAPLADVKSLTATYRIAGTVPLLSPIAFSPGLLDYFNGFIVSKWESRIKLAELVRYRENANIEKDRGGSRPVTAKYRITIIHAEDDYDIPWSHSQQLFWSAVNASSSSVISYEELESKKAEKRTPLGAGGWFVEWQSKGGIIREEILKHGLHDRIMSYPVVSLAVLRAFQGALNAS